VVLIFIVELITKRVIIAHEKRRKHPT